MSKRPRDQLDPPLFSDPIPQQFQDSEIEIHQTLSSDDEIGEDLFASDMER